MDIMHFVVKGLKNAINENIKNFYNNNNITELVIICLQVAIKFIKAFLTDSYRISQLLVLHRTGIACA